MQKKIIILCTVILIVVMEALFALIGAPVSYTHLTLPTN